MNTDPWINPNSELPPPPTPKAPEKSTDPIPPGATSKEISVICCPKCGGIHVYKDKMRANSPRITWQCRDCRHLFPLPANIGRERAAIL